MSNHIDPKVKEVSDLTECAESKQCIGIMVPTDALRALLSEYKRLQTALTTMAESNDEWYVGTTPMREYACAALSHLKGE